MKLLTISVLAAMALPAGVAQAQLAGQTISGAYYFPDTATPYGLSTTTPGSFVVGAGQEALVNVEGVTFIGVDFSAAALGLVLDTVLANPRWNNSAFNGLIFTSAAFAGITSVSVNGASTFAGFDNSRVSIVGNDLRVNWNGLSYIDGTTLTLDFVAGAIPEPAVWGMMIVGFGAAGTALRRQRRMLPTA